MGPSSAKSDVGHTIVGTSVLIRGKKTGDEISLLLSYLVLGLLFARAFDALSLPEQVIRKRLFLEVKCVEMAANL